MEINQHAREKILKVYEQGCEAVVTLVATLTIEIEELKERIKTLEAQLTQDSHNSHQPPSSDGLKRITKNVRPKSERSSGGQRGHQGTTLTMVTIPDHIEKHSVEECQQCGHSLKRVRARSVQRRQVFDIPKPRIEVTEHQCEVKECPHCGATTTAPFPTGVTKAAQYGNTIKSVGTYLMQYQLLPSERTQAALEDLFGCSVSEGTLFNWANDLHVSLESHEQTVKEQLMKAPVLHNDETGLFCQQKLQWLHVASTPTLTHLQVHPKRGTQAMDAIGILPEFTGTAIHDSWKPYFAYACAHSICNAHLIRELTFAYEQDHQRWAKNFSELLLRIHDKVEDARQQNQAALAPRTLRHFERQYDTLLTRGLRSNPRQRGSPHRRGRKKQTKTRNLLERLRDHRRAVLAFMYDFRVAFTNNQAERDLRMAKVKQKISGTFRSPQGAEIFCRIRGYLSTARKNAVSAFDALARAFARDPFIPVLRC